MLTIKQEIARKIIHLSNLLFPIIYILKGKDFLISFLLPIVFIFILFDLARLNVAKLSTLYDYFFGQITRKFESNILTGASNVLLSTLFVSLIFDMSIVISALIIMSISDVFAAMIGRLFGKIKIFTKTLEGSIAFFLSSLVIILLVPNIVIIPGIIAITIATMFEMVKIGNIDDNLSVPISFSISYFIMNEYIFTGII